MRGQGAERLLHLMTRLPDELLDEAISYQKPVSDSKPGSWMVFRSKGALVAACLCVCLIGGLVWGSTLGEAGGETGATKVTVGGVTAGGAAGGHEGKPTLAPPTEQTGARPVDSTDEIAVDSTNATPDNAAGEVGVMVSEFFYKGQLYVDTGVLLEELPDDWRLQGVISRSNFASEMDWVTKDPALMGAKVYGVDGDDDGFYVETEGGYRYYGKGSAGQ